MNLASQVAERIAARMRADGFECDEADVWEVYSWRRLKDEVLASRIREEFSQYGIKAHA